MKHATDVLVIGGGIAGLTAVRQLTCAGLNVVLLEARDRLGGRIFTHSTPAFPVELGAEFVHGRPEEILGLAAEAGVPIVAVKGEYRRKTNGEWGDAGRLMEKVEKLFERMPADGPDHSFADFLECSSASDEVKEQALRYVEGFHAANPSRISVHSLERDTRAEEKIDGDRQFRIASGYGELVRAMYDRIEHKHCTIVLKTAVSEIRWHRGEAVVRAPSAEFHAPRAVITVPLGVLKANCLVFVPALAEKEDAMKFLEMGPVIRVVMHFREKFWEQEPEMTDLSFLFTDDPQFPTWWTSNPLPQPILTGWAAGRYALLLKGLSIDAITTKATESLARILNINPGQLQRQLLTSFTHDWQADPFSRGAYSYAAAGGINAARALARPVEDTLYFAGEATNFEGYGGTVHGAIATGYRAAREVLRSAGMEAGAQTKTVRPAENS
jgi:monoamine oxidase